MVSCLQKARTQMHALHCVHMNFLTLRKLAKLLSRASNSLPHQPYSSRLNEYGRSNGNTVPKEDEITRGKMVMRIGRDGWDTAGG